MKNQKRFYNTKKKKAEKTKWLIINTILVVLALVGLFYAEQIKTKREIEKLAENNINTKRKETIEVYEVVSETIRNVTAYNAGDENQTDDNPCISASNKNICEMVARGENVCAANFVPFGTELQIIAENGWEFHCVVEDRMNSRYPNGVDVAMNLWEKDRALKFGRQKLNVRILGEETTILK